MTRLSPDMTAQLGAIFQDACEKDPEYRRLFLGVFGADEEKGPQRTEGPDDRECVASPIGVQSRSRPPAQAYHDDFRSKPVSIGIPPARLELATCHSVDDRSIHLSYGGMPVDSTSNEDRDG